MVTGGYFSDPRRLRGFFAEQAGAHGVPVFHALTRCSVVERSLVNVLFVQPDVALEQSFKVFGAKGLVSGDDLGQSSIEPLDHAVGLRQARPG